MAWYGHPETPNPGMAWLGMLLTSLIFYASARGSRNVVKLCTPDFRFNYNYNFVGFRAYRAFCRTLITTSHDPLSIPLLWGGSKSHKQHPIIVHLLHSPDS